MRIRALFLLIALALLTGSFAADAGAASIKWRFEVDGQYILQPPVVAPDGNIAVVGSSGRLYSLTPAGALRWSVPSVGGEGGPSIGPDGTVYVATGNQVTAVAPDGTIRWTYTEPSSGQGVIAGPSVGPDGNIYVVSDFGGLGAFSLSPSGQLRWSNAGNPIFSEYGQLGAEIVFDSQRMFVAFDEFGVAPSSTLYALSLDGAQQWAVPVPASNDMFMQRQAQPATGPDASLYLTGMSSSQGWQLRRFNPANGSLVWTFTLQPANGMSPPTVGPDGSVYYSRSLGFLDAVNSAGDGRWTFFDETIVDQPRVTPNGALVAAGDRPNFGEPGTFRGWNAVTGALEFTIQLPTGDDGYQIVYTPPGFSPDSSTAYFGTATFYRPETSFLYAIDISGGPPPPPPPAPPAPPPPAPARCQVPRVIGLRLAAARTRIRRARCTVGTVRRARSSRARGRVIRQAPRAGTVLAAGGRVRLTVSGGR